MSKEEEEAKAKAKAELVKWYESRPQEIKHLIDNYPPGKYLVKEGAPYSVTAPGVEVTLLSYMEDGQVGVALEAKDKTQEVLDNEKALGAKHNRSQEDIQRLHDSDLKAHVDPIWLEIIKVDPEWSELMKDELD